MEKDKKKIILNTLFWGFILWLFGYILGLILFAFVPQDIIGFFILPLGVAVTLWVLSKKAKRDSFGCYVGLGVIWTLIAVVLDYLFIVKLFKSTGYYKLDVYIYYGLTFILPLLFGWFKLRKRK
jgi:hypothetical protein